VASPASAKDVRANGVERVPAFIYLCNMATEGECLDRMLFGTNAGDSYSGLAVGDRVFLYNYEFGILRGPFVATTKSTPNLVPGAWKKSKGRFPWQIRVDGSDAFKTPMGADDVAAIIPLSQTKVGLLPPLELTDEQAEQLLSAMSGIQ